MFFEFFLILGHLDSWKSTILLICFFDPKWPTVQLSQTVSRLLLLVTHESLLQTIAPLRAPSSTSPTTPTIEWIHKTKGEIRNVTRGRKTMFSTVYHQHPYHYRERDTLIDSILLSDEIMFCISTVLCCLLVKVTKYVLTYIVYLGKVYGYAWVLG